MINARWRMTATVLGAVLLFGAGPSAHAQDPAQAYAFYRIGLALEQSAKADYTRWIRTLDVSAMDDWSNQVAAALKYYRQAVRMDPALTPAHRRLGFLVGSQRGTLPHNQESLIELTMFLALASPDDPDVAKAKTMADGKLRLVNEDLTRLRRTATQMAVEKLTGSPTLMSEVSNAYSLRILDDAGQTGLLARSAVVAPGRHFGYEQRLGVGTYLDVAGFFASNAHTVGRAFDAPYSELEEALARSASYVAGYLLMMGEMHRFRQHLDARGIPYDARYPEMLVGESVVQLRSLFRSSEPPEGEAALREVRDEYRELKELDDLRARDLWATFNPVRPLDRYLFDMGTMTRGERDEELIDRLQAQVVLDLDKVKSDNLTEAEGMAPFVVTDAVADEARKAFEAWVRVHLDGLDVYMGLPNETFVFVRDYERLGSGRISAWQMGDLPNAPQVAQADRGATDWLLAGGY